MRAGISLIIFLFFPFLTFIILTCNHPTNPFDSSEAKVGLILISSTGQVSDTAITDTTGNIDTIGLVLYLTQHIDSTRLEVKNGTILEKSELYTDRLQQVDTVYYPISFSSAGTRTVTAKGYVKGKVSPFASAVIHVIARFKENHPPLWNPNSVQISGQPGSALLFQLADICTDPDGDALTYSVLPGSPVGDTVIGSTWSFSPAAADTGVYSVYVVARDPSNEADTLTIDLTIKASEIKPPVINFFEPPEDSQTVSSSSYQITVSCTDESGIAAVKCEMISDTFPVFKSNDTLYAATVIGLRPSEWNDIRFIAIDSAPAANSCTLHVHIKYDPSIPDNVPPAITLISPAADTIIDVNSFLVRVTCTDDSGVALVSMSIGTDTVRAVRVPGSDEFTGTVLNLAAGKYSTVSITAVDSAAARNSKSISVRIKYDNDASGPTITRITPLTEYASTNAPSYTIKVSCTDSSGVASVRGTLGAKSFTGSRGTEPNWTIPVTELVVNMVNTVTVTATDSSLKANQSTLDFYITYDPTMLDTIGPTIKQISGPASGSTIKDPIVVITDSITDPSKLDSVYWTLNGVWAGVLTPVSGAFQVRDTLTTYHANRIVIHAIDSSTRHNRDSAVITLEYNVPPVLADTALSTNKNKALTAQLRAVSADGDTLVWSRISDPANGALTGTLPSMTYTPVNNFSGADSFDVRVTDGTWSDTGKVRITIVYVNYPPVMTDTTVATSKNNAVTFNLSGTDPDGTALTGWAIVTQGTKGNAALATSPANRVTYTPNNNATGNDSFYFRAGDGSLFDTGKVVVTIANANFPPVAKDSTISINEDASATFNLSGTDPDNDPLSGWAILKQGSNGTATLATSPANRVTYTPSGNFSGKDTFSFRVGDGALYDTGFIWVTIAPVNDTPTISRNLGLTVNEGATGTINTSYLNFSDPDNQTSDFVLTVTVLPKNGQLTLSGAPVGASGTVPYTELSAGNFRYVHNGSETTADSFSFTISDGVASRAGVFKFTISPVNDPPTLSKTGSQMKNTCGIGNYYRDTVTITDAENAFSSMTVTMVPTDAQITKNTNGTLWINWCVDFNKYSLNQAVKCTLRVVDGPDTASLAWTTTIGKHVWTKILTSTQVDAYMSTAQNSFAAHDSFKIYTGQDNGFGIADIYCWTSSSSSGSWARSQIAAGLNHGGMWIQTMQCNNTRMLVAGALGATLITYNTTTNAQAESATLFSGTWQNVFLSDANNYFYTVSRYVIIGQDITVW